MDLSGPGIDVKLKEKRRKQRPEHSSKVLIFCSMASLCLAFPYIKSMMPLQAAASLAGLYLQPWKIQMA
jgi:hypothetical protein